MAGSNLLPSAREEVLDPKSQKFTRGWLLFFEQIATRLLPLLSGDPATFLNGVGAFTSVAPKDAEYLVATANSTLTAERVTTDTATVTWDQTTPAQAKANVPNDGITNAKLDNMAAATIKLRAFGAGTGDPVDGTANQASAILDTATDPFVRTSASSAGITQLTSDVTAGPGTGSQAATIANDAVTNAKAANMADSTIKGRAVGGGTGDPTDLTANQTSTILDTATDPFLRTSAATSGGTVTHTAGALTASAVMVGNGAADSKVLASLGTTTTVLHGNAAGLPTFGAVALASDVSGDLPFANLTQIAGLSVLGVTGSSTADVAAITASADGQVLRRVSSSSVAFSAIGVPVLVRKTSSENVTSSTALQDDDELLFPVGTSETWEFRMYLSVAGSTAGDFQFAINAPASSTGMWGGTVPQAAASGLGSDVVLFTRVAFTDAEVGSGGVSGTTDALLSQFILNGLVITAGTSGNVKLRWAQSASNGTATTVKANSYLIATRLA